MLFVLSVSVSVSVSVIDVESVKLVGLSELSSGFVEGPAYSPLHPELLFFTDLLNNAILVANFSLSPSSPSSSHLHHQPTATAGDDGDEVVAEVWITPSNRANGACLHVYVCVAN